MIRTKILMISLMVMAGIAALLGITQMWWDILGEDIFFKTLGTLLIFGTLFSFLVAVNYDLPGSRGRLLLGALVLLCVFGAGLLFLQLWWGFFAAVTFGKLLVTDLILIVLTAFIIVASEDLSTNKDLKDNKYID